MLLLLSQLPPISVAHLSLPFQYIISLLSPQRSHSSIGVITIISKDQVCLPSASPSLLLIVYPIRLRLCLWLETSYNAMDELNRFILMMLVTFISQEIQVCAYHHGSGVNILIP